MVLVQQLKKSWSRNKIDVLFLFLNPCSVWEGSWWLQHIFQIGILSPNLISSSFSKNNEAECTWTYSTWAYTKPHSQLKGKNSPGLVFVCWIFFFCFWLYSAKIYNRPWPRWVNMGAFAWVNKRCPLKEDQPCWESFYRAEPAQLGDAALAIAHRPSFLEILKTMDTLKFVNFNGNRPH